MNKIFFLAFLIIVIFLSYAEPNDTVNSGEKIKTRFYRLKVPRPGFLGEPNANARSLRPTRRALLEEHYSIKYLKIETRVDSTENQKYLSKNSVSVYDDHSELENYNPPSYCFFVSRDNQYLQIKPSPNCVSKMNCLGITGGLAFFFENTQPYRFDSRQNVYKILLNSYCDFVLQELSMVQNKKKHILKLLRSTVRNNPSSVILYQKEAENALTTDSILVQKDYIETQIWNDDGDWIWSEMSRRLPDGYLIIECKEITSPQ